MEQYKKKIIKLCSKIDDAFMVQVLYEKELAIYCQQFIDFGKVIIDYLPGDGIAISIDGSNCDDRLHVTPECFYKLILSGKGKIIEEEFIRSTSI